jgi:hypothetical protein
VKQYHQTALFYALALLFFCIDVCSFFLWEHPTTYFVLCLFITQLAERVSFRLVMTSMLIACESLIIHEIILLPLVVMIPLIYVSQWINYYVYGPLNNLIISCALYCIIHGGIEMYIFKLTTPFGYTFSAIIVNIILMIIISLTLNTRGKPGNRPLSI